MIRPRIADGVSRRLAAAAAMTLAIVPTACVNLLPDTPPPPPRYTLHDVSPSATGSVDWGLVVEDPVATRAIDIARVARTGGDGRYTYYGGGDWADRAPRLFQHALVRSFENTGAILNVGEPTGFLQTDFRLQTDLRALEAEAGDGGAMTARVAVYARLASAKDGVVAARLFDRRAPLSSDDADAAATMLDRLAGEVIDEIVDWTLETGETAYAK